MHIHVHELTCKHNMYAHMKLVNIIPTEYADTVQVRKVQDGDSKQEVIGWRR